MLSSALLSALIEAIVASVSWLAGVARSILGHFLLDLAARGGEEAVRGMTTSRRDRRRARRHLRRLARSGEIESLILAYRRLGRSDEFRDLRIDAIVALAAADPGAAEPVLREIIEGPDDPWVVVAALDRASKHRMAGLLPAIAIAAEDDIRPLVGAQARGVHKRLLKVAARQGSASL